MRVYAPTLVAVTRSRSRTGLAPELLRKFCRSDPYWSGLAISLTGWSLLWLQALLVTVWLPQSLLALMFFLGLAMPGIHKLAGCVTLSIGRHVPEPQFVAGEDG